MKYMMNENSIVNNGNFWNSCRYNWIPEACSWACAIMSGETLDVGETPKNVEATNIRIIPMIDHITNCNTPASDVPMIFPIMSWNGLTDEMMISMMRLVFSSITERMTILP